MALFVSPPRRPPRPKPMPPPKPISMRVSTTSQTTIADRLGNQFPFAIILDVQLVAPVIHNALFHLRRGIEVPTAVWAARLPALRPRAAAQPATTRIFLSFFMANFALINVFSGTRDAYLRPAPVDVVEVMQIACQRGEIQFRPEKGALFPIQSGKARRSSASRPRCAEIAQRGASTLLLMAG